MNRLFFAALTAAAILTMTSCGTRIPRLDDTADHKEGYDPDSETTVGEEETADGDIADTDVYADNIVTESGNDDGSLEKSHMPESDDTGVENGGALSEGFVGSFAFRYDENDWEVLAQPGIGYQLTYRSGDDKEMGCCQIIISVETEVDMSTVMDGVLSMYGEEAEFEDAVAEDINGLPVQRVHGTAEQTDIDLMFSRPAEDGDVLVVQCITENEEGFEQAAKDAGDILDSFCLR